MSKIPTAEEFLKQVSPNDEFGLRVDLENNKKHIYEIMRRFAKLHVEAALKEVLNNTENWDDCKVIPVEKVLNAYPLENIK